MHREAGKHRGQQTDVEARKSLQAWHRVESSTQRPSVARSWALKDDLVNLEADVAARNEAMALRSQSDLYGSASSWTVSFAAESDDDARCWLESLPWSQLVDQTRDSAQEQTRYSSDERKRETGDERHDATRRPA